MSTIQQRILPARPFTISMRHFSASASREASAAIANTGADILGLSLRLSKDGNVDAVAFATTTESFYLSLCSPQATRLNKGAHPSSAGGPSKKHAGMRNGSQPATLNAVAEVNSRRPTMTIVGFSMAKIALLLHRSHEWHTSGVDLSSLLVSSRERPMSPFDFLDRKVDSCVKRANVDKLWYPDPEDDDEESMERACLRAWITAICADSCLGVVQAAKRVNTRNLGSEELSCIGRMVLCSELLEAQKPLCVENEFQAVESGLDAGSVVLENARFKTRVRKSEQTSVVFDTTNGQRLVGKAITAQGKKTTVHIMQGQFRGGVARVTVHGREELTNAEMASNAFLLRLLQGEITLRPSLRHLRGLAQTRFTDIVWFPPSNVKFVRPQSKDVTMHGSSQSFTKLNGTQREVALAMISSSEPLVISHGPPGTGKTTTIAAAVDYWESKCESVWIIAQSNVGVKNIARSFVEKGVTNFKLIVSKEFYVEWHEHLYDTIKHNIIRSDDLSQLKDQYEAERFLGGSTIVLSTLSMLSNPVLDNCRMFLVNPVKKLVVDEASQINVFEFMHLFHKFKELEKVCFFGDPKQLPPYGQESVHALQSIFDIKHLKPLAYFLDTQYRMPVPLGEFISRAVYNSKLKTEHSIRSNSCVAFINVAKGQEVRRGKSWANTEEVNMVVALVSDYYRHKDFCVITPYDAQRTEIQRALERANLPSEQVYNVDSFQGHEESYVIVSTVRTTKPGFLAMQSRTNVMLSRCKAGMVLVTNTAFVLHSAERTLLGKLASAWAQLSDGHSIWIDWGRVLDKTANLPGAPSTRVTQRTTQMSSSLVVAQPVKAVSSPSKASPAMHALSAPALQRTRVPERTLAMRPAIADSLHEKMGRLRLGNTSQGRSLARVDDAFPTLGGVDDELLPKLTRPKLKGRWKKGSAVIKC